jgi:hypothetical protein
MWPVLKSKLNSELARCEFLLQNQRPVLKSNLNSELARCEFLLQNQRPVLKSVFQ